MQALLWTTGAAVQFPGWNNYLGSLAFQMQLLVFCKTMYWALAYECEDYGVLYALENPRKNAKLFHLSSLPALLQLSSF